MTGESPDTPAELTVIMVSYNTRDITIRAIETLQQNAGDVDYRLIVWDNASSDGSVEAIAHRFPDIELVACEDNLGFAEANNRVAANSQSEWLLLLNPDTETHPNAIANILAFGKTHPEAGIVGGRTVFPDGSLNIASCWNRMTPWSLFCTAVGLNRVFAQSPLFNAEAIGGWKRDSVRQVDIVVGCFLLIRRELWNELGGFNSRYFMYGEEADLCLRAAARGYRPMITPDAQIMHLVGAAASRREEKTRRVMRSKASLVRDHWSKRTQPVGLSLLWLWAAMRYGAARGQAMIGRNRDGVAYWRAIWNDRKNWLAGYQ